MRLILFYNFIGDRFRAYLVSFVCASFGYGFCLFFVFSFPLHFVCKFLVEFLLLFVWLPFLSSYVSFVCGLFYFVLFLLL
ncbi:hypothetical protein HanIR_Chr04g0190001 [Helianthus annuus]|nr:hypothetical protein HanIR_Chr04g0190001 [Helianthus annuus]